MGAFVTDKLYIRVSPSEVQDPIGQFGKIRSKNFPQKFLLQGKLLLLYFQMNAAFYGKLIV